MENDMGELVETLRHLKVNELEKLREDLHLALTMRDQYFIQLGDARRALERIRDLDPAKDSDEGSNEWGEADCFHHAQKFAREALEP